MKFTRIGSFLCFSLSIFSASAQDLHLAKVDSLVTLIEDNNRSIGSLVIWKNGEELYNRDFGQREIPEQQHNQQTKYKIGSITKTYTAVLIFQLVENGRLSLDDKLEKFFPEMPRAKEITIRQMLNHTSGLGDYAWKKSNPDWLNKKVTEQQILKEIKRQGLVSKPGEKEEYSNSAYYLLAKIAEKMYNNDFGRLIREQICEPLGLKNTASLLTDPGNVYESFEYNQQGKWAHVEDFYFPNTKGAGDIVATPEDLLKFINALFHYQLLKKETVELMKPLVEQDEYFGRGLMQIPMRTQLLLGHGGDTKGTHSLLGYNEKDSVSIALLINGQRYTRNQFLLGVLSCMYEEPFGFPEFNQVAVSAEELDQYVGVYSSPELPIKITVSHEKEQLYLQGTGQPAIPMEAYDKRKFQFEKAGVKVEFVPESNIMHFQQGGIKLEMKREK